MSISYRSSISHLSFSTIVHWLEGGRFLGGGIIFSSSEVLKCSGRFYNRRWSWNLGISL